MAKYSIRTVSPAREDSVLGYIPAHRELVETADYKGDPTLKPCHWTNAHDWVRAGRQHMTGLWFDGERIRYAESDPSA